MRRTILALLAHRAVAFTSSNSDLATFVVVSPTFDSILGNNASIELLSEASDPIFHEGTVYNAAADTLFVSSNRINVTYDPATSNQTIQMHAIKNVSAQDRAAIRLETMASPNVAFPNGGTAYKGGLLFTAQGTKNRTSGLFAIPDPLGQPNVSVPVVTSFFGRQFNSPNDVVVNGRDGSIWFTDPDYGYSQGFRNKPELPNMVYRYDPVANTTRAVVDGIQKPNGIAFNADFSEIVVTDSVGAPGPATIYKFDVVNNAGGNFVVNKRLFAYAPAGGPDGIRIDKAGNVWSGTGVGLTVWNPAGDLLGHVRIKGGVANFGFGPEGMVWILGEKLLWRAKFTGDKIAF